jgi:hypothetical protein
MNYRMWNVGAAVAFGVGTWFFGWWAVPVIALAAGASRHIRPLSLAVAALAAWGVLLVIDSVGPGMQPLTVALSGVMGVPSIAVILLTWIFPALLAWSFGTIGRGGR